MKRLEKKANTEGLREGRHMLRMMKTRNPGTLLMMGIVTILFAFMASSAGANMEAAKK